MTHPVIAGGLAAQLDRLADIVKRNWTWPSPAAGFASWLFRRLGKPAFFAHPTAKFTPDLLGRLGEAPVLAAYGYALASGDEPDPVGDRLVVLPTLFHLLWTGVLRADLRTSPLGGATIIATARGAW